MREDEAKSPPQLTSHQQLFQQHIAETQCEFQFKDCNLIKFDWRCSIQAELNVHRLYQLFFTYDVFKPVREDACCFCCVLVFMTCGISWH